MDNNIKRNQPVFTCIKHNHVLKHQNCYVNLFQCVKILSNYISCYPEVLVNK